MKRPAFQFYPKDWGDDPRLQVCSLAARGLWIELMRIMHDCEPYGHLVRDGKPIEVAHLSLLVRAPKEDVVGLLSELKSVGVPGIIEKNGVEIWTSKRMVRDEKKREEDAKRKRRQRVTAAVEPEGKQRPENVTPLSGGSHSDVTRESRRSSSSTASSTASAKRPSGDLSEIALEVATATHVHWDAAIQNVVLDEDWLRDEISEFQSEAGAHLTLAEYQHEAEQLRLKLLEDPRLRACIRKANGKPSSPAQFKRLETFTLGWFKRAVRLKAGRQARPARASPVTKAQHANADAERRKQRILEAEERERNGETQHGTQRRGLTPR